MSQIFLQYSSKPSAIKLPATLANTLYEHHLSVFWDKLLAQPCPHNPTHYLTLAQVYLLETCSTEINCFFISVSIIYLAYK